MARVAREEGTHAAATVGLSGWARSADRPAVACRAGHPRGAARDAVAAMRGVGLRVDAHAEAERHRGGTAHGRAAVSIDARDTRSARDAARAAAGRIVREVHARACAEKLPRRASGVLAARAHARVVHGASQRARAAVRRVGREVDARPVATREADGTGRGALADEAELACGARRAARAAVGRVAQCVHAAIDAANGATHARAAHAHAPDARRAAAARVLACAAMDDAGARVDTLSHADHLGRSAMQGVLNCIYAAVHGRTDTAAGGQSDQGSQRCESHRPCPAPPSEVRRFPVAAYAVPSNVKLALLSPRTRITPRCEASVTPSSPPTASRTIWLPPTP